MMFSRHGARHAGRRNRAYRLWRADPVVPFLLIGLMGAAIGGITLLASRSPQWPAAIVTDCSLPAYKTERPSCADTFALRPVTPPFKGANAPSGARALQH